MGEVAKRVDNHVGKVIRERRVKMGLTQQDLADVVVMDNLGSHKGKAVRRAIRSAGAKLLFLPKYSPDILTART